jgi:hypothetical protein
LDVRNIVVRITLDVRNIVIRKTFDVRNLVGITLSNNDSVTVIWVRVVLLIVIEMVMITMNDYDDGIENGCCLRGMVM